MTILLLVVGSTATAQSIPALRMSLGGHTGTAVLLDVASNRIVAANHLERAARTLAAPGSTLKPLLLLDALEHGRIAPEATVSCPRVTKIRGTAVNCAHPLSEREFDASEALVWSCNTYFAQLASRYSGDELAELFRSAGLTSPTGLVAPEVSGTIAPASLTDDIEGRELMALGLEGITVTPLELVEAYRKLALRLESDSSRNAVLLRNSLRETVTRGMAHAAYDHDTSIAGKTGTALDSNQAVSHGWFVGYAPAEHPKVAVVVLLENARGADAAQVGGKVLREYGRSR